MDRSAPRSRCAGRRTGSAVPFGLGHEGRRALDAEEADLTLEVVAHVLTPVVVAEPEAGGDAPGEGAEALAHRLPDRLAGLEAGRAVAGMDADALGRAWGDPPEHRRPGLGAQH